MKAKERNLNYSRFSKRKKEISGIYMVCSS